MWLLPSTQNSPIMATLLSECESARYKELLSCCPFHVVPRQHSTRYHFAGMRCVYALYENKRKHSHKFWQGEILSWLVSLGEEKEGEKREPGLWLGTRTGIEGSFTSINHSLLIHPFILWDKEQAGPLLGVANNAVNAHREVREWNYYYCRCKQCKYRVQVAYYNHCSVVVKVNSFNSFCTIKNNHKASWCSFEVFNRKKVLRKVLVIICFMRSVKWDSVFGLILELGTGWWSMWESVMMWKPMKYWWLFVCRPSHTRLSTVYSARINTHCFNHQFCCGYFTLNVIQ